MRIVNRFFTAVVLALVLAAGAAAQTGGRSFLWKVQSGANVMYLAGSVHALTADAYPLNPAYQRAFEASSALVEEIDLAEADPLTGGLGLLAVVLQSPDGIAADISRRRQRRAEAKTEAPHQLHAALRLCRREVVDGVAPVVVIAAPPVVTGVVGPLRVQRDREGAIQEPTIQPGSGSTDVIARLRWSRPIRPGKIDAFASASYKLNTENPLDYRFGDEALLLGGMTHRFASMWSWSLRRAHAQLRARRGRSPGSRGRRTPACRALRSPPRVRPEAA